MAVLHTTGGHDLAPSPASATVHAVDRDSAAPGRHRRPSPGDRARMGRRHGRFRHIRNRRVGEHAERSTRRPSDCQPHPGEPPYPPFLGVSDWQLVTSVMSAALTVAFFGYLA